jgi:uncharacterized membrane protein
MLTAVRPLTVVKILGIGAGTGAAVGAVVNGEKGAIIGSLVGAGGSALYTYLLTGGLMLTMDKLFFILLTLATLGCGLMAGFFFSFSALVMPSLARQPQAAGMAAMQTINVVVFNPWFGAAFVGTPAACVLVMIYSLLRKRDAGAIYILIGGALYLVGTLLVTVFFNVPRNEALAAISTTDPGAAGLWASYLASWTAWNHVRTTAALAGAALLIMGIIYQNRRSIPDPYPLGAEPEYR